MSNENKFDTSTSQYHPDVDSGSGAIDIMMVNNYQLIEQAFYGTDGFKDGYYLVPHHRELFYNKRRQYSHYANYINPIITAMYKACFGEKIKRDYNNDMYKLFEDDCTSNGTNLTDFVKLCVKYVRLHGMILIVVDNKSQEGFELRKEVIENKKIPHCYIKKAYEINTDGCIFDDYGKLISVMYFDHCEKDENKTTTNFFRYWNNKETILYEEKQDCDSEKFEKKYKVIDKQKNELGKLPVQLIYEESLDNPKKLFSIPLRYQLAKINHTIFNQDSEGRTVERDQGFGLLTIPTDASGDQKDISIGTNNCIFYPAESKNSPEMIVINPNLLIALAEKRNAVMESLIAIAEQSGVQGITKSKDAKSGLAYAFEFFAYESTLKDSSRLATLTETTIRNFFNEWTNEKVEYEINYPKNFKPNKVSEEQKNINESLELVGIPKSFSDKLWIEKFKIMYPDDDIGLDLLKKELEEQIEPENLKDDV